MYNGYLLNTGQYGQFRQYKRRILLTLTASLLVFQLVFATIASASPAKITNEGNNTVHIAAARTNVPVTGVTINKSSITLKKGGSETLKATLIPSNATNKTVYWESSNTAIAKVDLKKGKVMGVKAGTAIITVVTEDGNLSEVCEVTVSPDPNIVTFNDINLENVVRKNIDKATGDLFKSDVNKITNLDARNQGITDLSGIEKLKNLKYLNLNSDPNDSNPNQIEDLSYLTKLTQLKVLHLNNNNISDFDIIKKMTKLTSLDLSGNQISDLTDLAGLTKLTNLDLSNNQISDLMPIKKLTKLKSLYLENNEISNINPLKVLDNLDYLYLSGNLVSDSDIKSLRNILSPCRVYN